MVNPTRIPMFRRAPQSRGLILAGIGVILISFAGLTYRPGHGWWWSLMGSALIIAGARLAWPTDALRRLGLQIRPRAALVVAASLFVCAAASYLMIWAITRRAGLGFDPFWKQPLWGFTLLHTAGQTLNEEMVIGALLLAAIRRALPAASLPLIAIGVAAAFSGLHFVFYKWLVADSYYRGTLDLSTLASLWMVGIVRQPPDPAHRPHRLRAGAALWFQRPRVQWLAAGPIGSI